MEQQFPAFFDLFLSTPYGSFVQDAIPSRDQGHRGFVVDLSMESVDFNRTWLTDSSMADAPYHSTVHSSMHVNQDEQAGSPFSHCPVP
jgi:hypothetical protein